MNEKAEIICPWCHTEIIWDPEIGPEEECPHCFNELSDYRSIQLTVKQTGEKLLFGEDTEEDEDLSTAWEDSDEPLDAYGETVQKICDQQVEAPECSICHEFMLYAGDELVEKAFVPHVPEILGKAFLQSSYTMSVYVCPSCFKVDKFLSDADRTQMVDIIKSD